MFSLPLHNVHKAALLRFQEGPTPLAVFIKRFGFSDDDIAKISAGEDAEPIFTAAMERINADATTRVREGVKKDETAAIAKGIWVRAEKLLLDIGSEYGITADDFKDVEEKDRFKTIGDKVKTAVKAKLDEVTKGNPDAAAVSQLTAQNEAANKALKDAQKKLADMEKEVPLKIKTAVDGQFAENQLSTQLLTKSPNLLVTNPVALTASVRAFMAQDGVDFHVERPEGGQPKIYLKKADGTMLPRAGQTDNHTLETYLDFVLERAELVKKSNGNGGGGSGSGGGNGGGSGSGGGGNMDKDTMDEMAKNLPPEALAVLNGQ